MGFTFVSALLNSCILALLTNAELRYYPGLRYIAILLDYKGQYSDMSQEWYYNIGPQLV